MPDFYFALRVRIDINRYPSGEALLDRWLEESEVVEGAEQAGMLRAAWKDVNEPVVYPVLRIEADDPLEAHAALLEGFKGFPMGQDGALLIEHVAQVRPYSEWRDFLRKRKPSRPSE
jgi:hypothetical protein